MQYSLYNKTLYMYSHWHLKEGIQETINISYFWGLERKVKITMVFKFTARF